MTRYLVKPGYCLHLPNQAFAESGKEVELAGDLEQEVLANQGWKVEVVPAEPAKVKAKEPEPEPREFNEPPKDRAIKEAKTK